MNPKSNEGRFNLSISIIDFFFFFFLTIGWAHPMVGCKMQRSLPWSVNLYIGQ
jgi:hypothetical protein